MCVLEKNNWQLVEIVLMQISLLVKHTFKVLKRKNIKLVAVIHDLETMRYALVDDIPKKTKLMYQIIKKLGMTVLAVLMPFLAELLSGLFDFFFQTSCGNTTGALPHNDNLFQSV